MTKNIMLDESDPESQDKNHYRGPTRLCKNPRRAEATKASSNRQWWLIFSYLAKKISTTIDQESRTSERQIASPKYVEKTLPSEDVTDKIRENRVPNHRQATRSWVAKSWTTDVVGPSLKSNIFSSNLHDPTRFKFLEKSVDLTDSIN